MHTNENGGELLSSTPPIGLLGAGDHGPISDCPGPIDYVRNGWALCPIPRGQKGPNLHGWNRRDHAVTTPDEAAGLRENVGLCHAYSGTCAIDVDDLAGARAWLADRGIELDGLLNALQAVCISSGRANRAKLIFKLATPLPSKKIVEGGKILLVSAVIQ
jgi:hypothetical protein